MKLAAIVGQSLRLAVMLVVIALGVMLVMTYREMLHEKPAPSTAAPARSEVAADIPLLSLLRPGGWVLGDNSWTVAVAYLSVPAHAARLQSLGQPRASDAAVTPLEDKLLNWLHRSRPQVVGNCRVYDFPAKATRVRAVTEGQGKKERLRLMQVIWRQGNRPPQLLQATPVPSGVKQGTSTEHLLPLPPRTTVLARRWEDSGTLSAEVIRCSAPWRECVRSWTDAGWSVHTLPSSDASGMPVLLSRGEHKLHLCPLQGGSAGTPVVLLVLAVSSSLVQGNS